MRVAKLLCAIILLLAATGCWDGRELNEVGFIMGVGIDSKNEKYTVTAQVVNPRGSAARGSSDYGAPVHIFKAHGNSVFECLRQINTQAGRILNLGHLRVLVISESIVQKKYAVLRILDFFDRDLEVRADFNVMLARGISANKVLQALHPLDKNPSTALFRIPELSKKSFALSSQVDFDRMVGDYLIRLKNIVLPAVSIKGDKQNLGNKKGLDSVEKLPLITFDSIAVFSKGLLAGWLEGMDAKTYNFLNDQVENALISVPCTKKNTFDAIVYEMTRSSSRIIPEMKNNKPVITIKLKGSAFIAETHCDSDFTKPDVLHRLQDELNQYMVTHIYQLLDKLQHVYKSDVFGFANKLHSYLPLQWKGLAKDWERNFANLAVEVQTDLQIISTGLKNKPLLLEKKPYMN
ncbi:Ger(x)C family spore germination protein [Paenibacillus sp. 481]|uniref:Ger(x)C family spore germination protein n=1 Tax=Paenibacillus sp. 481 TaxID=2835869 RepID=UPI001E58DB53|nr:Ger(x)C family spore germination protein [Paenibacillus sp. 481]UHA75602.1 Ger(x)C family spore germination protein [Paenibacillus sp. 481]